MRFTFTLGRQNVVFYSSEMEWLKLWSGSRIKQPARKPGLKAESVLVVLDQPAGGQTLSVGFGSTSRLNAGTDAALDLPGQSYKI
ncbi:hypothetical protein Tco_0576347 [Tanacetum coccineum]